MGILDPFRSEKDHSRVSNMSTSGHIIDDSASSEDGKPTKGVNVHLAPLDGTSEPATLGDPSLNPGALTLEEGEHLLRV